MLELAGIIILGIVAQWAAWRFKIPAILPLIIIGLFVGPISTLITEDGSKFIEPVWNGEKGLFAGESLFYFVSLAISIILFEGGLTLKKREIQTVGPAIIKLITIGTLVTFFGAGLAAHYLIGLSWSISFLFSSLIIVTGPTVITPILRNITLRKDISTILKWEGILIDPIGALVAVLVFEFISIEEGHEFTQTALIEFGKIVLFGTTFGFTFAHAFYHIVKRKLVPHYLLNVATLAFVLGVFVLSDAFAKESGLLSVVVMGMVMGNINLPNIKEILYFKESLSILLISILFILLSANINFSDLELIYNWQTLILFFVLILVIRPLGVFLSTRNSGLKFKEKAFISWVGPRGIVAAGIASLFGLRLVMKGEPGAEYITPLVFVIVLGTVLLNATTARFMAKIFGVFLHSSKGIVIIGASEFSRAIAAYLVKKERLVLLIDGNNENIEAAKKMNLDAESLNVFSDEFAEQLQYTNFGCMLALTSSNEVNLHAMDVFKTSKNKKDAFRLPSNQEIKLESTNDKDLFSENIGFFKLEEITSDYAEIHEITIDSMEDLQKQLKMFKEQTDSTPLFVHTPKDEFMVMSQLKEDSIEEGTQLIYLGKALSFDK